jgi:hypothetical protein
VCAHSTWPLFHDRSDSKCDSAEPGLSTSELTKLQVKADVDCSARKVNNVDFGLSFGLTTGRVERSAEKTPRPSHATIRQPSKTPSRSGGRSSARWSVRSASATIDTRENEANKPVGLDEDRNAHAEEPGVKRRKTKGEFSAHELRVYADEV